MKIKSTSFSWNFQVFFGHQILNLFLCRVSNDTSASDLTFADALTMTDDGPLSFPHLILIRSYIRPKHQVQGCKEQATFCCDSIATMGSMSDPVWSPRSLTDHNSALNQLLKGLQLFTAEITDSKCINAKCTFHNLPQNKWQMTSLIYPHPCNWPGPMSIVPNDCNQTTQLITWEAI